MAFRVYIAQALGSVKDIQIVSNSVKDVIDKDAVKPCTLQCLVPSSKNDTDVCHMPSVSEWFVSLCRHYRLMCNPRFTVLSHRDMAHILQLGVAEKNKLAGGSYDAADEVVIEMLEKIGQLKLNPSTAESDEPDCDLRAVFEYYKAFLASSNHVDLFDVYAALVGEMEKESDLGQDLAATIVCCLGAPSTALEKKMLQFLCGGGEATILQVGPDGTSSVGLCEVNGMAKSPTEDHTSQHIDRKVYTTAQTFICKTILSYIHLLVNTRSELALVQIFNIPDRDLDHSAFTAVKREAKKKNLPMYQMLTSFVMRLRLGGKGYAPDRSSPLLPHVKGFSLLMGMVQKLQGIVEEEPDISSACQQVVKVIKKNLAQCSICKFTKEDLDVVTENILSRIAAIIEDNERKAAASPDKPASEGGSLTGRRSLRIFQQLLDWTVTSQEEDNSAVLHLDSITLGPTTPIRFPSLLSKFRSPIISEDSPVKPVQHRGLKNSTNLKRQPDTDVEWPCGEKRRRHLEAVVVLPSKTLVSASEDTQQRLKGLSVCSRVSQDEVSVSSRVSQDEVSVSSRVSQDEVSVSSRVSQDEVSVSSRVSQDEENVIHDSGEQKPCKKAKHCTSSPKMAVNIVSKKLGKTQANKKKASAKGCRRRLLPQVEGQKQITSFFRI